MIERRKEHRRRCILGGELSFETGRSPVDCLLRNVGKSGAMILLDETIALPAEFELYIHNWRRRFRASRVWSSDALHGVAMATLAAKVIPFASRTKTKD